MLPDVGGPAGDRLLRPGTMRIVARRSDPGATARAAERATGVTAAEEQEAARSGACSDFAGPGCREQLDGAFGDLGQGRVDRRSDRMGGAGDGHVESKLVPARRVANGRIEHVHGCRIEFGLGGGGTEQRPQGVAESAGGLESPSVDCAEIVLIQRDREPISDLAQPRRQCCRGLQAVRDMSSHREPRVRQLDRKWFAEQWCMRGRHASHCTAGSHALGRHGTF